MINKEKREIWSTKNRRKGERDIPRQRDRVTKRQRGRERERNRERQRNKQTERERDGKQCKEEIFISIVQPLMGIKLI